MKQQISNKLAAQLEHLTRAQLNDLTKRALQLRLRTGDRSASLDVWVQRVIQKDQRVLARAEKVLKGTLTAILLNEVMVQTEQGVLLARPGNHSVIVGDHVQIGQIADQWMIVEVEPRRTKLSRPDVGNGGERLIVANVDYVVIVVSVVSPPLHPRLIDRYLIAIQNGGAKPVICVNKVDLLTDEAELDVLIPYREGGVPVIACSALEDRGIGELRELLAGQTVVFVGHSGVGKSSLANAFSAELGLKTGLVSAGYGRGTHTTTVSSLHQLSDGTVLIDTPGIRSFGLWSTTVDEVGAAFPEIQGLECRFRDCSHTTEPGCGILAAVADGRMSQERYETMMRLRAEVA
jgi:ribosome biogenesis GTPase